MSDDDTQKSFEPSQKKLDDARKKGEIARSSDLQTAAAYFGLVAAFFFAGPQIISNLGTALAALIMQSATLSKSFFSDGGQATLGSFSRVIGLALLPLFSIPAIAVILTIIVQRGFTFVPSKLQLKLDRISPLANAKNKYGKNGLFEFFKSFTKLLIYSVCLFVFLKSKLPILIATIGTSSSTVTVLLGRFCLEFLIIIVLIASIIGCIDAFWQHSEHHRKNMMSRKEIVDESKESEGDPHLKQARQQRAQAIAMSQMMSDIPDADVVVVNPTHYAVALKWSRLPGAAPICVAKGVDEVAYQIRRVANETGVPIHSDPPTARTLHSIVQIGAEIPPDLYAGVAAAIRFSEKMKLRLKGVI
ncbi:MAG: flagellar type III secretion system protein FlhB [Lentilitoribacter sp.]